MNKLKSSLGALTTKLGRHDTYKPRIPLSKGYPADVEADDDPAARQHLAPGSSSGGGPGIPARKLRASHRDPFAPGAGDDTGRMEEPTLGRVTMGLLALEVFLAFIAMCCLASLAAFQTKWKIGVCASRHLVYHRAALMLYPPPPR